MTLTHLKTTLSHRAISTFIFVSVLMSNSYAASMKSGLMSGSENTEALRSYGSYLFLLMLGITGFLVIFRGREMLRQHPKAFH
jgi:hypothetical protein